MKGDGCLGLTQAVNALRDRVARRPTEQDAPPCSTFPMTPAAREALRLSKQGRGRRHEIANHGGVIVRVPPA